MDLHPVPLRRVSVLGVSDQSPNWSPASEFNLTTGSVYRFMGLLWVKAEQETVRMNLMKSKTEPNVMWWVECDTFSCWWSAAAPWWRQTDGSSLVFSLIRKSDLFLHVDFKDSQKLWAVESSSKTGRHVYTAAILFRHYARGQNRVKGPLTQILLMNFFTV